MIFQPQKIISEQMGVARESLQAKDIIYPIDIPFEVFPDRIIKIRTLNDEFAIFFKNPEPFFQSLGEIMPW